MNCIEIFSGAGGLAKGLEQASAKHIAFVERDHDACNTLRSNFEESIVHQGDIRAYDFTIHSGIDLLAGGPPCQPFSLGGKARGSEDKRDMFPAAIAAIRATQPQAFIFENVKGLLRESFADYFNYILLQLAYPFIPLHSTDWKKNLATLRKEATLATPQACTYEVRYKLVNAADYGVPQKRERVIIVGFRSDLGIQWDFPSPTHSEDALLWSKYVTSSYWERHGVKDITPQKRIDELKAKLIHKYGMFPPTEQPWRTIRDALSGMDEQPQAYKSNAREYAGHTGSYIDEPSKTIKAGAHGVPGGENMIKFQDGSVRYYTVQEAKRIQTFPDNYQITGSWTEAMRQLGNAVPVELARIIGTSVIGAIHKRQAKQT